MSWPTTQLVWVRMDQPIKRQRSSLLALSRQGVAQLWLDENAENLTACAGYALRQFGKGRDITLLAIGTQVSWAIEAPEALFASGIAARVVSLPCRELFEPQSDGYRAETLGTAPRIAIAAVSKFGWTRDVESEDDVIGMTTFGGSAPVAALYETFGNTKTAIVAKAKARLQT